MVQGVQGRRYLTETTALAPVNAKTGTFTGLIRSREQKPRAVVCLFAGTRTLASPGAGPVPIG
jgi:hypothetical protein